MTCSNTDSCTIHLLGQGDHLQEFDAYLKQNRCKYPAEKVGNTPQASERILIQVACFLHRYGYGYEYGYEYMDGYIGETLIFMDAFIHIYRYPHSHKYTNTCIHIYIAYSHSYHIPYYKSLTCIYTYIHPYTYAYTYTYPLLESCPSVWPSGRSN
ncbi:hypothetical protein EON63_02610 [archaeon]|nr:MAG: hypothetical protein EON63_02610 [archaeon]